MANFRMDRFFRLEFLGLYLCFVGLQAQTSSTTIALDSVTVTAYRIPKQQNQLPFSVSQANYAGTQDQRQQLTLADYLLDFPGVLALNTQNFAQDLRVSIRGFGARAAFGIRGIKILVDGIPETTPDGQGQVDNLNLGAIEQIELIRGGAASLYGNASGGVIAIATSDSLSGSTLKTTLGGGSFGFRQWQVQSAFQQSNTLISTLVGHTQQEGYRSHSRFENLGVNLKIKQHWDELGQFTFLINYAHSPRAQDPGGITAEDVVNNRRQARQRNVDYQAGEAVSQLKTGAAWQFEKGNWQYQAHTFFTHRDFLGFLPFEFGGLVDLKRNYAGGGGSLQHKLSAGQATNHLRLNFEGAWQEDHRQRFRNLQGEKGSVTLDQNEQFNNWGLALFDDLQWQQWTFMGGLRYDRNRLAIDDHFLENGDASDQLFLPSWNYSLGVNFRLNPKHRLFINSSSSYETPVLSELSANPSGGGGFNSGLQPQTALTYELGYGWQSAWQQLQLTIFNIDSRNAIVPYEVEAYPGRTFFRNAGKAKRQGLELSYNLQMTQTWQLRTQYSYSNFTYTAYELPNGDFTGNRLPGIPQHQGNVQLYHKPKSSWQFRWVLQYRGAFFADDANLTQADAVMLLHGDASWTLPFWTAGQLYFGFQNLTNARYSDNVRLNAFGQRYFEPAPVRSFFGGIRLGF